MKRPPYLARISLCIQNGSYAPCLRVYFYYCLQSIIDLLYPENVCLETMRELLSIPSKPTHFYQVFARKPPPGETIHYVCERRVQKIGIAIG